MDFLTTILANSAVTTVLIGTVAWLARTWIKEKLSRSIKHAYDLDLEKFKAVLAASNSVEIEKLKARLGTEYKIVTEGLLRYSEKQFELYNELWASLCDIEVYITKLWESATMANLQKFANQVHNARLKIKKSALLIEDRHYRELNHILDQFEDFQFGKKQLIDLRKANRNEHVDPEDIRYAIESNAAIKDRLIVSLSEMMACLKSQIIRTEENNNFTDKYP